MSKLNRRHFLLNAAGAATGLAAGITVVEYAVGATANCPVITQLRHPAQADAPPVPWTASARARLERVPAGFMRTIVERKANAAASAAGSPKVTLAVTNRVIEVAKAEMNLAVAQTGVKL